MNHSTPPTGHLGHSIKRLYHLMGQHFNDVLRPYGVAHSQWYLLYALHTAGELTQRQLQDQLQIESATLTAALAPLEAKGWIARRPSPTDRRTKLVSLTPAGHHLWQSLPDPIAAIRMRLLQGISPAEEELAQGIIDRAITNFQSPITSSKGEAS